MLETQVSAYHSLLSFILREQLHLGILKGKTIDDNMIYIIINEMINKIFPSVD